MFIFPEFEVVVDELAEEVDVAVFVLDYIVVDDVVFLTVDDVVFIVLAVESICA